MVTAELPPEIFEWSDSLRRAHFPPERNKLKAHVTLFHALPPSVEGELRQLLGELTGHNAPKARISGLMKLGTGTALAVECPGMLELHAIIQDRMHGLMTPQDTHTLRLHITIQNKVTLEAARALQEELGPVLEHREFRFRGFELFAYEDGLWRPIRTFRFRG
ncbi:MAG: 2'-5' RNA ligase family protein [Sphingomonadaceae bacterium]|nr:2'-5' RNA ligase family protein [Sphingomonadaceae bacterium]